MSTPTSVEKAIVKQQCLNVFVWPTILLLHIHKYTPGTDNDWSFPLFYTSLSTSLGFVRGQYAIINECRLELQTLPYLKLCCFGICWNHMIRFKMDMDIITKWTIPGVIPFLCLEVDTPFRYTTWNVSRRRFLRALLTQPPVRPVMNVFSAVRKHGRVDSSKWFSIEPKEAVKTFLIQIRMWKAVVS